jgi:IS4 transposase
MVYAKSFKCNIKISCVFFISDKGKETRKIYFSSDLEMLATDILEYYRSRFQIELEYRDGKQFAGLDHCQARSENTIPSQNNIAYFVVFQIVENG